MTKPQEALEKAKLLSAAIELSAAAHADQTDRAGEPYILHPLRVMLACYDKGNETSARTSSSST